MTVEVFLKMMLFSFIMLYTEYSTLPDFMQIRSQLTVCIIREHQELKLPQAILIYHLKYTNHLKSCHFSMANLSIQFITIAHNW